MSGTLASTDHSSSETLSEAKIRHKEEWPRGNKGNRR